MPRRHTADFPHHLPPTAICARRRYRQLFRSCMLMPPSRTRTTCLRSNIAPRLAGENVQHIDMLCMSHSVCLYAFNSTSYIVSSPPVLEKDEQFPRVICILALSCSH